METKKNNLFLYVLISLFVFTLSIGEIKASEYVNYYGITMNNEEYNNLLELGFSEDEIYYMNEETFEENKDIESSLVVKDERYYKTIYTDLNGGTYSAEITKDEYDTQSSMNTRGTVETEYKRMVTTMSKGTNTFRYKVSLAWKQFPAKRSYDIIGIGFEDDVYISSSVYFLMHQCDEYGNCSDSTVYYDKNKLSTGGSVAYKLPSGNLGSLSSTLYYDVSKINSSQTITELIMCGDYSHATSTVSGTSYTDHTVNINGLVLGSSIIGKYDEIPCAMSGWIGTW